MSTRNHSVAAAARPRQSRGPAIRGCIRYSASGDAAWAPLGRSRLRGRAPSRATRRRRRERLSGRASRGGIPGRSLRTTFSHLSESRHLDGPSVERESAVFARGCGGEDTLSTGALRVALSVPSGANKHKPRLSESGKIAHCRPLPNHRLDNPDTYSCPSLLIARVMHCAKSCPSTVGDIKGVSASRRLRQLGPLCKICTTLFARDSRWHA